MSKLSKMLDRVSGRNRSQAQGEPEANSTSHGGTPYPNPETVEGNGNSGDEGPRHSK